MKSIGIDVAGFDEQSLDVKYKYHIEELVINKNGNIVDNIKLSDLVWKEDKGSGSINYENSLNL